MLGAAEARSVGDFSIAWAFHRHGSVTWLESLVRYSGGLQRAGLKVEPYSGELSVSVNAFKLALLGACAVAASAVLQPVFADQSSTQTADTPTNDADSASALGEVVVTARRRSESIVDVPISLTVVTAQQIQDLDIKSTTDLANYTPGLEFNNFTQGDARNDRGADRPIVIRGLNISSFASGQGATMFLDGAAVSGNEIPADMDIGQVEVLRGPQSVYFGRSTMTGAVSYRTRPISDEWSGEIEGEFAQQNEKDFEGTIAGPVIPDLLKLRVTGLSQSYGGYVTNSYNNASSELGATSRRSISATAILTPTAALEFKGYVNYFRDEDGPAATAFVPATNDNCKFAGATYTTFCGEVPSKSYSINYSNLLIPSVIAKDIFSTPLIAGQGFREELGQQRSALNSDIVGTWTINSLLQAQEITGYHDNITVSASDGYDQPVQPSFAYANYMYTYATEKRDFSQEFRLTSDSSRRVSFTVGGNYIHLYSAVSAFVGWIPQVAGVADTAGFFDYNQPINPQDADTYGAFGGAYFKATSALNFSLEARYQSDHIYVTNLPLTATFKSFTPRFAVDYDVGGNRKIYASYSIGDLPGGFNTSIDGYKGNALASSQIQNLLGSSSDSYKEEKLDIGELGFKGNFSEGRGFFDINSYYGVLKNEQILESALIPALGFSVSTTNNAGKATIYGLEWQGAYTFDNHFSINTTYAWNHTRLDQYEVGTGGIAQFGVTNFNGKAFPFVPQFSGSAVFGYTHELTGEWNGFANLAETFRGREFTDYENASYIPGRYQTDVHLGVADKEYNVEVFVKNVFNDEKYTGGGVTPDYGTSSYYAFFGGWAPPRQVGVRLRAKF